MRKTHAFYAEKPDNPPNVPNKPPMYTVNSFSMHLGAYIFLFILVFMLDFSLRVVFYSLFLPVIVLNVAAESTESFVYFCTTIPF